jgi:carbon-monoxide dehydrogenase small subunit
MLALDINGKKVSVDASPLARLLDVLRGPCGLTGTKEGCGEGECGSCTVLIDGLPVNACLVLAGQVEGKQVTTIEGLAGEHLTPLQTCFIEDGGAQCGICTPGMIISAEALLRQNKKPNDEQIRDAIAGNICRCTGYQRIVDAIRHAAELRGGAK